MKDFYFLLRELRRFVALIACVVLCSVVNVQQGTNCWTLHTCSVRSVEGVSKINDVLIHQQGQLMRNETRICYTDIVFTLQMHGSCLMC
jgi:hypothetical protein